MLAGSALFGITCTETTRYVRVRPSSVVTSTCVPRRASFRRTKAPGPFVALSTWPAINVEPDDEPGVIPSTHQPSRWISGGTASAPDEGLIPTGKTRASIPSETRALAASSRGGGSRRRGRRGRTRTNRVVPDSRCGRLHDGAGEARPNRGSGQSRARLRRTAPGSRARARSGRSLRAGRRPSANGRTASPRPAGSGRPSARTSKVSSRKRYVFEGYHYWRSMQNVCGAFGTAPR